MRRLRTVRLRSVASFAGIAVAVAGGFGAAVGVYTLPDPQKLGIDAHAYARVQQHAMAVWSEPVTGGTRFTRVQATRGGSAGGEVIAARPPTWEPPGCSSTPAADHTVTACADTDVPNAYFSVAFEVCTYEGECNQQGGWSASIPGSWFQFDPLMRSASFSGDVPEYGPDFAPTGRSCRFDVVWTADPEGVMAPVAGYDSKSGGGPGPPWHADAQAGGFGEISRVAPAQLTAPACFPTEISAPGYLSQALQTRDAHVHVFEH